MGNSPSNSTDGKSSHSRSRSRSAHSPATTQNTAPRPATTTTASAAAAAAVAGPTPLSPGPPAPVQATHGNAEDNGDEPVPSAPQARDASPSPSAPDDGKPKKKLSLMRRLKQVSQSREHTSADRARSPKKKKKDDDKNGKKKSGKNTNPTDTKADDPAHLSAAKRPESPKGGASRSRHSTRPRRDSLHDGETNSDGEDRAHSHIRPSASHRGEGQQSYVATAPSDTILTHSPVVSDDDDDAVIGGRSSHRHSRYSQARHPPHTTATSGMAVDGAGGDGTPNGSFHHVSLATGGSGGQLDGAQNLTFTPVPSTTNVSGGTGKSSSHPWWRRSPIRRRTRSVDTDEEAMPSHAYRSPVLEQGALPPLPPVLLMATTPTVDGSSSGPDGDAAAHDGQLESGGSDIPIDAQEEKTQGSARQSAVDLHVDPHKDEDASADTPADPPVSVSQPVPPPQPVPPAEAATEAAADPRPDTPTAASAAAAAADSGGDDGAGTDSVKTPISPPLYKASSVATPEDIKTNSTVEIEPPRPSQVPVSQSPPPPPPSRLRASDAPVGAAAALAPSQSGSLHHSGTSSSSSASSGGSFAASSRASSNLHRTHQTRVEHHDVPSSLPAPGAAAVGSVATPMTTPPIAASAAPPLRRPIPSPSSLETSPRMRQQASPRGPGLTTPRSSLSTPRLPPLSNKRSLDGDRHRAAIAAALGVGSAGTTTPGGQTSIVFDDDEDDPPTTQYDAQQHYLKPPAQSDAEVEALYAAVPEETSLDEDWDEDEEGDDEDGEDGEGGINRVEEVPDDDDDEDEYDLPRSLSKPGSERLSRRGAGQRGSRRQLQNSSSTNVFGLAGSGTDAAGDTMKDPPASANPVSGDRQNNSALRRSIQRQLRRSSDRQLTPRGQGGSPGGGGSGSSSGAQQQTPPATTGSSMIVPLNFALRPASPRRRDGAGPSRSRVSGSPGHTLAVEVLTPSDTPHGPGAGPDSPADSLITAPTERHEGEYNGRAPSSSWLAERTPSPQSPVSGRSSLLRQLPVPLVPADGPAAAVSASAASSSELQPHPSALSSPPLLSFPAHAHRRRSPRQSAMPSWVLEEEEGDDGSPGPVGSPPPTYRDEGAGTNSGNRRGVVRRGASPSPPPTGSGGGGGNTAEGPATPTEERDSAEPPSASDATKLPAGAAAAAPEPEDAKDDEHRKDDEKDGPMLRRVSSSVWGESSSPSTSLEHSRGKTSDLAQTPTSDPQTQQSAQHEPARTDPAEHADHHAQPQDRESKASSTHSGNINNITALSQLDARQVASTHDSDNDNNNNDDDDAGTTPLTAVLEGADGGFPRPVNPTLESSLHDSPDGERTTTSSTFPRTPNTTASSSKPSKSSRAHGGRPPAGREQDVGDQGLLLLGSMSGVTWVEVPAQSASFASSSAAYRMDSNLSGRAGAGRTPSMTDAVVPGNATTTTTAVVAAAPSATTTPPLAVVKSTEHAPALLAKPANARLPRKRLAVPAAATAAVPPTATTPSASPPRSPVRPEQNHTSNVHDLPTTPPDWASGSPTAALHTAFSAETNITPTPPTPTLDTTAAAPPAPAAPAAPAAQAPQEAPPRAGQEGNETHAVESHRLHVASNSRLEDTSGSAEADEDRPWWNRSRPGQPSSLSRSLQSPHSNVFNDTDHSSGLAATVASAVAAAVAEGADEFPAQDDGIASSDSSSRDELDHSAAGDEFPALQGRERGESPPRLAHRDTERYTSEIHMSLFDDQGDTQRAGDTDSDNQRPFMPLSETMNSDGNSSTVNDTKITDHDHDDAGADAGDGDSRGHSGEMGSRELGNDRPAAATTAVDAEHLAASGAESTGEELASTVMYNAAHPPTMLPPVTCPPISSTLLPVSRTSSANGHGPVVVALMPLTAHTTTEDCSTESDSDVRDDTVGSVTRMAVLYPSRAYASRSTVSTPLQNDPLSQTHDAGGGGFVCVEVGSAVVGAASPQDHSSGSFTTALRTPVLLGTIDDAAAGHHGNGAHRGLQFPTTAGSAGAGPLQPARVLNLEHNTVPAAQHPRTDSMTSGSWPSIHLPPRRAGSPATTPTPEQRNRQLLLQQPPTQPLLPPPLMRPRATMRMVEDDESGGAAVPRSSRPRSQLTTAPEPAADEVGFLISSELWHRKLLEEGALAVLAAETAWLREALAVTARCESPMRVSDTADDTGAHAETIAAGEEGEHKMKNKEAAAPSNSDAFVRLVGSLDASRKNNANAKSPVPAKEKEDAADHVRSLQATSNDSSKPVSHVVSRSQGTPFDSDSDNNNDDDGKEDMDDEEEDEGQASAPGSRPPSPHAPTFKMTITDLFSLTGASASTMTFGELSPSSRRPSLSPSAAVMAGTGSTASRTGVTGTSADLARFLEQRETTPFLSATALTDGDVGSSLPSSSELPVVAHDAAGGTHGPPPHDHTTSSSSPSPQRPSLSGDQDMCQSDGSQLASVSRTTQLNAEAGPSQRLTPELVEPPSSGPTHMRLATPSNLTDSATVGPAGADAPTDLSSRHTPTSPATTFTSHSHTNTSSGVFTPAATAAAGVGAGVGAGGADGKGGSVLQDLLPESSIVTISTMTESRPRWLRDTSLTTSRVKGGRQLSHVTEQSESSPLTPPPPPPFMPPLTEGGGSSWTSRSSRLNAVDDDGHADAEEDHADRDEPEAKPTPSRAVCQLCERPYASSVLCPVVQQPHAELLARRKHEKATKKMAQALLRAGKITEAVQLLAKEGIVPATVLERSLSSRRDEGRSPSPRSVDQSTRSVPPPRSASERMTSTGLFPGGNSDNDGSGGGGGGGSTQRGRGRDNDTARTRSSATLPAPPSSWTPATAPGYDDGPSHPSPSYWNAPPRLPAGPLAEPHDSTTRRGNDVHTPRGRPQRRGPSFGMLSPARDD